MTIDDVFFIIGRCASVRNEIKSRKINDMVEVAGRSVRICGIQKEKCISDFAKKGERVALLLSDFTKKYFSIIKAGMVVEKKISEQNLEVGIYYIQKPTMSTDIVGFCYVNK